jgi:signal transduction histidine kinase
VRAWLGLPLVSRGQVIGMISLDWMEIRPFTSDEIDLAMAFANQAGIAIENARLYEQTQSHAAELELRVKDRTAELESANQELRALGRLKDEFVSNVSHELRTPITNLNLRYHLMSKQPELFSAHMPVVRRETNRLARIIDDLLTLSRMDQERTPFKLVEIDLNMLVQQFIIDRVPQAESLGLLLTVSCIVQPLPVLADAGLLEQALSVLLTNAMNYTPSGGIVTVSTHMRRSDEDSPWCAGFRVQDTGPGIRKEEQARLFTRFFRGTAGQDSRVSGTGLGLAIAKEIVNRHHGQIGVESSGILGQGSAFTIWLPMIAPNRPATT